VLEAVRIMSSTYNNRYTMSEPRRKTNREVSDLASANPSESRKDANRLYQAWAPALVHTGTSSGGRPSRGEQDLQSQSADCSRLSQ
jgi:hypothetical protein